MTEREIFFEALEMATPEARAAYLLGACGQDFTLRRKVEELLKEHFSNDSLLAGPALEGERDTAVNSPVQEAPAQMIGRYKLLEKIGEGGFGEVWMAEQREPVKRRVALKIIKPGMDSRQIVARFEAERQALAMMDHANIARIFDADVTDTGRSYFVMELVRGIKITDYCDQNQLPTRERLDLFIKVCQAIQHAHQKGVIHRDIKPSNILVTLHDGVPVPKVIDFGIAKATQQELTDKTVFTQFQQFIGTPAYISPEQAEMSGLDIDTRADIYGLGVLLYELLVGQTPFDAKDMMQGGLDAMRQIIREKEPMRPSTKLNTLQGDARTTAGQRRQTDVGKLVHQLQGDLDWIVMKCLEKDRTRRYDTANGLAKDIERHLGHEPITARPPSTAYRFRKFVRRNKLAVSAAGIVAAALIAGFGFSTWSFLRERAQHREADKQRYIAKANAVQASGNELHARRLLYASDMNLAQRAFEDGKLGGARRLLDRHRPAPGQADLRGWEWRLLWQQCRGDASSILTQRPEGPFSVSFSPGGRRLAVGYYDGRVELWDIPTRTLTRVLQEARGVGHFARVAFSPVADVLAASAESGVIKWHDFVAGTEKVLFQTEGRIREVAFSNDGAQLAIRTMGKEAALVVDAASGAVVCTVDLPPGNSAYFNHARISPDHERLYVTFGAFNRPQMRCVGIADGKTLWERDGREPIQQKSALGFSALDVSPDGSLLATATGYSTTSIQLWSAESGERLGTLEGHTAYVMQLAFSRDGKSLVSASNDQTVRFWDTAKWREATAPLRGHGEEVSAVALAPDGQTIATGSKDGTLMLWDARAPRSIGGRQMLADGIRFARALPDSKTVLLRREQGDYSLIDFTTLRETTLPFSRGKPIHFAPRKFIGIQEAPNLFQLHEVTAAGATLIAQLPIEPQPKFAYCEEKRLLAWTKDSKTILLTSLDLPADEIALPAQPEGALPVRFSTDGCFLLATDRNLVAQVWDLKRQQRLAAAENYFSPFGFPVFGKYTNGVCGDALLRWLSSSRSAGATSRSPAQTETAPVGFWPSGLFADRAFSPDGRTFAIATELQTTILYDTLGPKKLATLHGRGTKGLGLAFSPDGTRFVRTNDVLWDVTTRQELLRLPAHGAPHFYAEFTDDGSTLLVGSPEQRGSFQFWRAPSRVEIDEVERRGGGWPQARE